MRKSTLVLCFLILSGLGFSNAATADMLELPNSKISMIANTWYEDQLEVIMPFAPVDNGCGNPGSYVVNPAAASNELIKTLLISAYMAGKPVTLLLLGCTGTANVIVQVQM